MFYDLPEYKQKQHEELRKIILKKRTAKVPFKTDRVKP